MPVTGGKIVIDLTYNDGQFKIGVRDTENRLRSLERHIHQTADSTKRMEDHLLSAATRFRHFVMMAGMMRFALMDFNQVVLGLPTAIAKTSGEIERMTALLKGLSRASTEAARDAEARKGVDYIIGASKNAPFEIAAIQDAFVKLKSAGLDPMDGSLRTILDNLARFGGTSEHLKRVSIAIQQMAGKGVISMEELRQQLGEAMPNAMRAMSQGMGLSMGRMTKLISDGVVSSLPALERMVSVMRVEAAGAAAEMMKTWVGLTARLKTEWELFKKSAGDAGFFDEAKKALQGIVDGMGGSAALQRFAANLGETLRKLVVAVAEIARFVYENGQAFLWGAKAIGAYLAASYLVFPALQSIKRGYTELAGAWRSNVTDLKTWNQAYADALNENTRRDAAARLTRLQGLQQEMTEKRAQIHNSIVDERRYSQTIADLQTQRAAIIRRIGEYGGKNKIAPIDQEIRQTQALLRVQEQATAQFRQQAAVIQDKTERVRQHAAALNNAAAATGAVGRAATFAAGAMGVLRSAMVSVNLTVTALTLGIGYALMKLYEWANAAEEAAARARRAKQGVSDAGDLKKNLEDQESVETKLRKLQQAQKEDSTLTPVNERARAAHAERMAERQREIDELLAQRTALQQQEMEHRRNLADADVRDEISQAERNFNRLRESEQARQAQRKAQFDEQKEEELKRLKGSAAQINAAHERIARERRDLFVALAKADEALINGERERVNRQLAELGEGGDLKTQAKRKILSARQQQLEQLAAEAARAVENAKKIGTYETIEKDDKNKKDKEIPEFKDDPIQRAITQQEAKVERYMRMMNNIRGAVDGVSALRDEIDGEIQTLVEGGRYDRGSVEPTQGQADTLKEMMFLTKSFEAALELRKKIIADSRNSPEFEEALERLRDPLGVRSEGTHFRQASRMIADLESDKRLHEQRLEFLRQFGVDYDKWRADVLNRGATIDLEQFVTPMKQKSMELKNSMIEDTRERTLREYALETTLLNERFNAYAKNVQELNTLEQARVMFKEYMAAREAKMIRDVETPVKKLARDWENVTQQLEQASVGWANQTVDAIIQMTKTGKLQFSKLIDSILTDIARIQLQKSIARPLSNAIDMAVGRLGDWMMGDTGTVQLAKGGVMSRWGEIPLRMYSAGGVARSPQVAIFGEGAYPEAYVPLPDGRAIPVRMQGGAPVVNVNVINQSGVPVAAQQGQPRFDGRQMVLDIVLTAAHQPGPFRDGMKAAMG